MKRRIAKKVLKNKDKLNYNARQIKCAEVRMQRAERNANK